jgi:membrane protein
MTGCQFVPTLIVIVTVYGLVAKPADIQRQVHDFAKALPDEVQKFIQQQITSIGHASGTRISIALVIAVAIALWSASGGVAALVTGVNVARDQTEPKSFVKKRGKAMALTVGAIVLLVVMIFLIAAVPSILAQVGLGTIGRVVFDIVR